MPAWLSVLLDKLNGYILRFVISYYLYASKFIATLESTRLKLINIESTSLGSSDRLFVIFYAMRQMIYTLYPVCQNI